MGIRARYTLTILGLLLAAVVSVSAVSLVEVRALVNDVRASSSAEMTNAVRRSARDNGVATANVLAALLAGPVQRVELDTIGGVLGGVLRHPDIVELLVVDESAAIIHDGSPTIVRHGERVRSQHVRTAIDLNRLELWFEGDSLRVAKPIVIGEQLVGAVVIALSTLSTQAEVARLNQTLDDLSRGNINEYFLVLALALAALAAAAVLVADHVAVGLVRPIQQLRDITRRIGAGVYLAGPPFARQDEIGDLGTALYRMGADIQVGQDRLIQARDEATRASRAKSEFLANVSHELRTPLNAIIGFSDILDREMLGPLGNERYRGYAHDILFSGRHLLSVINAILDYSKADANKLELHKERANVSDIVNGVLLLIRPMADQGGVNLTSKLPASVPSFKCDEAKLRQALLNVVSNAVKFTPRGGVVAITAQHADGHLIIRVSDTGIGIAAADIPTALAPFGQVDGSLSRKHDGTGLGLPLAVRFVELHGGTLQMQSELGAGTTVTIRVPLDVADAATPSAAPTQSKAQTAHAAG